VVTYAVGTFDRDEQAYTPQVGLEWYGLTLWELRRALRALRRMGFQANRCLCSDGTHDSDPEVLVERVDGRTEAEVLREWKRPA
jgi:hypothetical protein